MTALETLMTHRSIRAFQNRPIEDEVLNKILMAASNGSTMGGMQLFSIIVTQDKEKMKEMAPFHFNQPMATNAPLILTFCADFHRFDRYCEVRHVATDAYHNLQAYQWSVTDALIAAQNACVAAESMGLGICWLGTITYNVPQFIQAFQLPKHVIPVACIPMGYPAEEPGLTPKLSLNFLIHNEVYREYSDTEIEEAYLSLEKVPNNIKMVEENHFKSLAQDYVERRYKKADNEYFSTVLQEVLNHQWMDSE